MEDAIEMQIQMLQAEQRELEQQLQRLEGPSAAQAPGLGTTQPATTAAGAAGGPLFVARDPNAVAGGGNAPKAAAAAGQTLQERLAALEAVRAKYQRHAQQAMSAYLQATSDYPRYQRERERRLQQTQPFSFLAREQTRPPRIRSQRAAEEERERQAAERPPPFRAAPVPATTFVNKYDVMVEEWRQRKAAAETLARERADAAREEREALRAAREPLVRDRQQAHPRRARSAAAAPERRRRQVVATEVPLEARLSFWPALGEHEQVRKERILFRALELKQESDAVFRSAMPVLSGAAADERAAAAAAASAAVSASAAAAAARAAAAAAQVPAPGAPYGQYSAYGVGGVTGGAPVPLADPSAPPPLPGATTTTTTTNPSDPNALPPLPPMPAPLEPLSSVPPPPPPVSVPPPPPPGYSTAPPPPLPGADPAAATTTTTTNAGAYGIGSSTGVPPPPPPQPTTATTGGTDPLGTGATAYSTAPPPPAPPATTDAYSATLPPPPAPLAGDTTGAPPPPPPPGANTTAAAANTTAAAAAAATGGPGAAPAKPPLTEMERLRKYNPNLTFAPDVRPGVPDFKRLWEKDKAQLAERRKKLPSTRPRPFDITVGERERTRVPARKFVRAPPQPTTRSRSRSRSRRKGGKSRGGSKAPAPKDGAGTVMLVAPDGTVTESPVLAATGHGAVAISALPRLEDGSAPRGTRAHALRTQAIYARHIYSGGGGEAAPDGDGETQRLKELAARRREVCRRLAGYVTHVPRQHEAAIRAKVRALRAAARESEAAARERLAEMRARVEQMPPLFAEPTHLNELNQRRAETEAEILAMLKDTGLDAKSIKDILAPTPAAAAAAASEAAAGDDAGNGSGSGSSSSGDDDSSSPSDSDFDSDSDSDSDDSSSKDKKKKKKGKSAYDSDSFDSDSDSDSSDSSDSDSDDSI